MNQISPVQAPGTLRKIVHITAKPGLAERLRAALLELEIATRREEGCVAFTFFQSLSAPGRFLLIEEFASEAALAAHMKLPHTQGFFALALTADIQPVAKDWLA